MSEIDAALAEIARIPIQETARALQLLTVRWQEVEDDFARKQHKATTVEDIFSAALGYAEARGGRRALEAVAEAMFAGLAKADR